MKIVTLDLKGGILLREVILDIKDQIKSFNFFNQSFWTPQRYEDYFFSRT